MMGSDQLEVIVDLERPKQEESFCYALQLLSTNILIKSLQATVELGIFDIIAKAGEGAKLSAAEIVAQLPTNNPDAVTMVDRILRMLAGHSVLTCSVVADNPRVYSHNTVSKCFVTDEDGNSLGSLISLLDDKVYSDSWSQLKGAILEGGIPFNRLHGMNYFEYTALDSRFNKVFNRAMQSMTTMLAKQTIESYKGFENLKQLVDVGGGLGVTLKEITSTYPHIKGINFDLPHVVQHAPSYPGVEHVGGDMFESVPSGDAIFMKWILHDWSDEQCVKVLKNCYKAIPENGKVIVMEGLLPMLPEASYGDNIMSKTDVLMMTQNPGGKERSKQEFQALASGAGFNGIRFECCVSGFWIMEFFK
uniref:caffeate O-methyltransferase n=1 Tax=Cannabis sativa TaxID=3483 RepID=A0A803RCJ9_CANSA